MPQARRIWCLGSTYTQTEAAATAHASLSGADSIEWLRSPKDLAFIAGLRHVYTERSLYGSCRPTWS